MSQIDVNKEKEFHNRIFEAGERKTLNSLYKFTSYIYDIFYSTIEKSIFQNATVLEYGCGMESKIAELAKTTSNKFAFDISDYAIEENKKMFTNIKYVVADAHYLDVYSQNKFDIIYGASILHHLDLPVALKEINRILKPGGKMIFLEPLGHNYFINRFRNKTPDLRTEDEHPLLKHDLDLIEQHFSITETKYLCLFPLFVYAVFKNQAPNILKSFTIALDKVFFSVAPFLRKYAWITIIVGTKKSLV